MLSRVFWGPKGLHIPCNCLPIPGTAFISGTVYTEIRDTGSFRDSSVWGWQGGIRQSCIWKGRKVFSLKAMQLGHQGWVGERGSSVTWSPDLPLDPCWQGNKKDLRAWALFFTSCSYLRWFHWVHFWIITTSGVSWVKSETGPYSQGQRETEGTCSSFHSGRWQV